MFSNRSVSVQPSAPPIEYAGSPDALIVFAAGRGNYAAWYLPARFADAGRGASLTFEKVRPGAYVVR